MDKFEYEIQVKERGASAVALIWRRTDSLKFAADIIGVSLYNKPSTREDVAVIACSRKLEIAEETTLRLEVAGINFKSIDPERDGVREAIERKTSEIISQGFMFKGHKFSMSLQAQCNWNTLLALRLGNVLDYPVSVSCDGARGGRLVLDKDECGEFLSTAIKCKQERLDKQYQLIDLVEAAKTLEQLFDVVDDREVAPYGS